MRHILLLSLLIKLIAACFTFPADNSVDRLKSHGVVIIPANTEINVIYSEKLYLITEEKMQKILAKEFVFELEKLSKMIPLYENRIAFLEKQITELGVSYDQEIGLLNTKFELEYRFRIDMEKKIAGYEFKNRIFIYTTNVTISFAVASFAAALVFGYLYFNGR